MMSEARQGKEAFPSPPTQQQQQRHRRTFHSGHCRRAPAPQQGRVCPGFAQALNPRAPAPQQGPGPQRRGKSFSARSSPDEHRHMRQLPQCNGLMHVSASEVGHALVTPEFSPISVPCLTCPSVTHPLLLLRVPDAGAEFSVVDLAIAVCVDLLEHLIHFRGLSQSAQRVIGAIAD